MKKRMTHAELDQFYTNVRSALINLAETGNVAAKDITRLFRGEFYYYVTFTKAAPELGVSSRDGYVVLVGMKDQEEADRLASSRFDGYISKVAAEYEFTTSFYRDGEFGRLPEEPTSSKEPVTLDQ